MIIQLGERDIGDWSVVGKELDVGPWVPTDDMVEFDADNPLSRLMNTDGKNGT